MWACNGVCNQALPVNTAVLQKQVPLRPDSCLTTPLWGLMNSAVIAGSETVPNSRKCDFLDSFQCSFIGEAECTCIETGTLKEVFSFSAKTLFSQLLPEGMTVKELFSVNGTQNDICWCSSEESGGRAASWMVAVSSPECSVKRVRESLWREDKYPNTPQSRLIKSLFLTNNHGWLPKGWPQSPDRHPCVSSGNVVAETSGHAVLVTSCN